MSDFKTAEEEYKFYVSEGENWIDSIRETYKKIEDKNIVQYFVRFHTEDDDKDEGDRVSVVILRPSNGQILAKKPLIGKPEHIWKDQEDQPKSDDATWGGVKGWFALDKGDGGPYLIAGQGVKLIINKTGDSRWKFRVDLMVKLEGDTNEYVSYQSSKKQLDKDNRQITLNA